jgi:enoyl-CoA hydratase/carnithine racemase
MESILVSFNSGIAKISINRPDKKNSLTSEMYRALDDAFKQSRERDDIKVVHLTGEGGTFSVGNDIQSFAKASPNTLSDETEVMGFLKEISSFPKPIVAEVSGLAVGVGVTCLLHCDFVYVETETMFSLPFVKLGLCPEAASTLILPRISGYLKSAEKLLLGDTFGSAEAFNMGIATKVLEKSKLADTVAETCLKISNLPPNSIRVTKAFLKSEIKKDVQDRMKIEGDMLWKLLNSIEAKEAFDQFLSKKRAS